MSTAIKLIVDGYAKLNDRSSLEELRVHRHRLAIELRSMKGFDCSHSISQLEDEIAEIEAGLASLSA